MGVPERDYAELKHWSGYRAALGWGRPAPQDQIEIAAGMADYRGYLRDLVDAKAGAPGDDLTSDLIAIHRESPERLTLEEIASILFSLSFAGHETTTGLIGNTVRRLLEEPERWSAIAAHPGLIPAAVEETLRYDPSVPVWRRVTTRPVTLAEVDLPAGQGCSCGWRRPAATRPASPSRTCSTCAGRLGTPPGLRQGPALLPGREPRQAGSPDRGHRARRPVPRLRLAPDQQLAFHPNISFRGPQVLTVRAQ